MLARWFVAGIVIMLFGVPVFAWWIPLAAVFCIILGFFICALCLSILAWPEDSLEEQTRTMILNSLPPDCIRMVREWPQ